MKLFGMARYCLHFLRSVIFQGDVHFAPFMISKIFPYLFEGMFAVINFLSAVFVTIAFIDCLHIFAGEVIVRFFSMGGTNGIPYTREHCNKKTDVVGCKLLCHHKHPFAMTKCAVCLDECFS